jgi:acid stress-induced BolA-like protein IbaG/YrbA
MISTEDIKARIQTALPAADIRVEGADGVHFDTVVIAEAFEGLSLVKRQQMVYQVLQDWITSGRLHAIALKTHTPREWREKGNHTV